MSRNLQTHTLRLFYSICIVDWRWNNSILFRRSTRWFARSSTVCPRRQWHRPLCLDSSKHMVPRRCYNRWSIRIRHWLLPKNRSRSQFHRSGNKHLQDRGHFLLYRKSEKCLSLTLGAKVVPFDDCELLGFNLFVGTVRRILDVIT